MLYLRVNVKVCLRTTFSAICPISKTRDDYIILIEYEPNDNKPLYIELCSLRKYLDSYQNEEIHHEELAEQIANDLHSVLRPKSLRVVLKSTYLGIDVDVEVKK